MSGEHDGAWEAVRAMYDRYTEPGRFDAIITARDARIAGEAAEKALREAADEIWFRPDEWQEHGNLTPLVNAEAEASYWLENEADRLRAEREGAGEGDRDE